MRDGRGGPAAIRIAAEFKPHIALLDQEADRERSRAAGFDRHFAKPLDFDVLDKALRELSGTVPRNG